MGVKKTDLDYEKILSEILEKGKMNNYLKDAVKEIKTALIKKDYKLVADLSNVKSFIIGEIDPSIENHEHFQEDSKYNDKVLGLDIYTILDDLDFYYSMKTNQMPHGVVEYSTSGIRERKIPKSSNFIIKLMEQEEEEMENELKSE